MTAAVAGRAAGAVRAGAVTQAEKDVLARRLAAAQAARGGGAQPVQKAPTTAPASPQQAQPAPVARAQQQTPTPAGGGWRPHLPGTSGVVSNGAGFILALAFWGWIILPFIKAGPGGVRDVIRAKFINKGPDGSWLP